MFRVRVRLAGWILVAMGLWCVPAPAPAADGGKGEEVTIFRDEFGIPNVFAETEEGAVFGAGYAQAEDRLEYLLKQYRRCEGTMSEAFGPENLREDYRQRVWRHRAVAEENFAKLSPKTRAMCEAFQDGIKEYMQEHPSEVPPWAPELHPWQIVSMRQRAHCLAGLMSALSAPATSKC
jgi:acyl-homoserine-lactone acylase